MWPTSCSSASWRSCPACCPHGPPAQLRCWRLLRMADTRKSDAGCPALERVVLSVYFRTHVLLADNFADKRARLVSRHSFVGTLRNGNANSPPCKTLQDVAFPRRWGFMRPAPVTSNSRFAHIGLGRASRCQRSENGCCTPGCASSPYAMRAPAPSSSP